MSYILGEFSKGSVKILKGKQSPVNNSIMTIRTVVSLFFRFVNVLAVRYDLQQGKKSARTRVTFSPPTSYGFRSFADGSVLVWDLLADLDQKPIPLPWAHPPGERRFAFETEEEEDLFNFATPVVFNVSHKEIAFSETNSFV